MPQPGPWQQSELNDKQLLQQHIMLKQMQELQRQQQLHQLGDLRQQNSLSQLSAITKQAAGGQFPNLINGEPLHDASQIYMNWGQHGASPALQGVPKGQLFSQEQGRTLFSTGQVPQQPDVSLYGSPVTNARGNLNRYPHLQGITNDHGSSLVKAVGNQSPKPAMHSLAFNTSFLGEQGSSRKNSLEQTPIQGLNNGNLLENYQQGNTHKKNVTLQASKKRQERAGWSGNLQDTATQISPSQSSVSLDPLETKILFGMNDNTWDPSFDGRTELGIGSFGNALEQTDCFGAFPSIQSGSWSALMQSAVAEASSSDTGLQEEWSGLTFQNMELSADNQHSNFVDSEKQHAGCIDSNMQNASSLSSKSFVTVNDSNFFPGFQHSGFQFSSEKKEGVPQNSHVSFQRSPKNAGNWLPCNTQRAISVEGSKQVQPLGHLENAWTSQTFQHSDSDAYQQSATDIAKSRTTEADKEASRQVPKNYHIDYMRSGDITRTEMRNDNISKDHRESSNGPRGMDKSDHGGRDTYEKQQNFFQRENSNDRYNSIALQHTNTGRDTRENVPSSARDSQHVALTHQESPKQRSQELPNYGQGFFGQSNIFDNVSKSAMDLEKRHLPEFQGNASEDVLSRGNLGSNTSASFDRSIGFYVPNNTAQTREIMPELYQKVDHLRKDSSATNLDSIEYHPLSHLSKAETPDAYAGQLYNQSSVSQGFGLRLAPPYERVANPNLLLSSQSSPQTGSNLNARHVSQELGDKGQAWLTSPTCSQSLSSSHRPSQREHQDGKFSSFKTSHLNMQGTSPASLSQIQRQHMPNAPVEFQSLQALSGPGSRLPSLDLASSQDNLRPINLNSFGQEFPVSEAMPVTQPYINSGTSQQGEVSVKPYNVMTNIPIRRLSSNAESHKFFSTDPSNISLETTSLASQDPNDQNSQHDGIKLSEFGACSTDQQGIDYGEEQQRKRSQHQVSSNILDPTSQTGNLSQWQQSVAKQLRDAGAINSGSLVAPLHPQDINRVWQGDNQAPAASLNILQAFGHSLQQSDVIHQNHSLLQQVQSMKNVATDHGASTQYNGINSNLDDQRVTAMTGHQSFYGHTTRVGSPMGNELNAVSQFRAGNDASFLSGARENNTVKTLSPQPNVRNIPSQEMVESDGNDTQSQFSNGNVASKRNENFQNSAQMANSWFQPHGNFKIGQMLSLSDPRISKVAADQFSFVKTAHGLHKHTSNEQVNSAIASQIGSVCPSATPTADQSLAVRPKKRKTATSELLPWHKEVTQNFQRLQNISMAEIEWVQAANRLTEKVEDKAALMEDGNPLLRPKKRLILTTQLMQQLLRPPPAAIFSVNAASGFDSVAYFVAKLSLGDACSLTSCQRSDYRLFRDKSNMMFEKLTTSERVVRQYFSKVMEDFTDRTKKLENDFLRLDKKASIVDLLVECQDLEKISIINRFAKFHIRGHSDATENSSCSATSAPKIFLQRYVTALPMPSRLPEGLQCLSL